MDKSFFCQEVILKESALFYLELDSCIHVTSHDIQYIWKFTFFEILDVLCSLGNVSKDQTAEGIRTAAKQKAIVAAGDHIILTKLALEHLVVGKAWFCAVHCTVDRFESKIIRSNVFVIFEA